MQTIHKPVEKDRWPPEEPVEETCRDHFYDDRSVSSDSAKYLVCRTASAGEAMETNVPHFVEVFEAASACRLPSIIRPCHSQPAALEPD